MSEVYLLIVLFRLNLQNKDGPQASYKLSRSRTLMEILNPGDEPGFIFFVGKCLTLVEKCRQSFLMKISMRPFRLLLIPLAVMAEILLLITCWIFALTGALKKSKSLMDFAFKVLPDKRWYIDL